MKRILLVYNDAKPEVVEALKDLVPWLSERAVIAAQMSHREGIPMEDPQADLAIVLGGDGTLLAQARALVELNAAFVGVNFGKVGFLAEFSLDQLKAHWEEIVHGRCPISHRLLLKASVFPPGGDRPIFTSPAMNDFVITAGQPFRMIDLKVTIDPSHSSTTGTSIIGDGVIVSTPTGSTAYNLSSGGPILAPDVDAYAVTAISPYSLAFRPIVVSARDRIEILLREGNPGTMLVIDGQISRPLPVGSRVFLESYPLRVKLVTNPTMGYWKTLAKKLHWAATPRRT